jgi:hypothetical protein
VFPAIKNKRMWQQVNEDRRVKKTTVQLISLILYHRPRISSLGLCVQPEDCPDIKVFSNIEEKECNACMVFAELE